MKARIRNLVVRILTWEARKVLARTSPRIVGVTGNVGKTSAKDTIAAVLATGFTVRRSHKNYNTEIGLPLAIMELESGWGSALAWISNVLKGLHQALFRRRYAQWLVAELGVDHPGDMDAAIDLLSLDVAVMTGMSNPPVHAEYFGSAEALYAEKAKIIKGLKSGGTLVANYDDEITRNLVIASGHPAIFFGTQSGASIHASNIHLTYRDENGKRVPEGLTFKLEYQGKSLPVRLPGVVGKNIVYAALAAIAVGMSQRLNVVEMIAALATAERPRGRLRLFRGKDGSMILDDTYNSSPTAALLALETLESIEISGRRIVVMGDMLELGEFSESAHRNVGIAAAKFADLLIVVGQRARMMAEGARDAGYPEDKIVRIADAKLAAEKVPELVKSGDLVLVKGSQGARMERVVKALLAEPARAPELLVRQEKVWHTR